MHPFAQSLASGPAPLLEPLEVLDPPLPLELPEPLLDELAPLPPPELPLFPSADASEALPGGAVEPPHRAVTTIKPARPARPAVQTK
jgi:hypothetical protein